MTHTYNISGMTCSACEAKVRSSLLSIPDITSVEVSRDQGTAIISMDRHVSLETLQQSLDPRYRISAAGHHETIEQARSWFETYKPLLILFSFITGISLATSMYSGHWYWMEWMRHFMASFFLAFSYFKLINIRSFAESYAMYDVIARRVPVWGWLYPFVELGLGMAYLLDFNPGVTNVVTLVVMGSASIGVIQSVTNKRRIQCACLGAVFNLPMSTVTIVEDLLMVVMAVVMLFVM